jgi:uncharacterized protein with FMN-binding domain
MPKRAVAAIAVTAIALALLFSFKTPADQVAATGGVPGNPAQVSSPPAVPGAPDQSTGPAPSANPVQPGGGQPPATPAPTKVARKGNGTYTGAAVDEQFGTIQVQATISNGKLTAVTVVQMPTRGRSGFISSQAAPILAGEAISAQSANIDSVSGATYTSQAYAQSLQSALDQAGFS